MGTDVGDTSEKPTKVFVGHNLGNRTFLMQMPMHEFYGMYERARPARHRIRPRAPPAMPARPQGV